MAGAATEREAEASRGPQWSRVVKDYARGGKSKVWLDLEGKLAGCGGKMLERWVTGGQGRKCGKRVRGEQEQREGERACWQCRSVEQLMVHNEFLLWGQYVKRVPLQQGNYSLEG